MHLLWSLETKDAITIDLVPFLVILSVSIEFFLPNQAFLSSSLSFLSFLSFVMVKPEMVQVYMNLVCFYHVLIEARGGMW